jgi:hypothetical protein
MQYFSDLLKITDFNRMREWGCKAICSRKGCMKGLARCHLLSSDVCVQWCAPGFDNAHRQMRPSAVKGFISQRCNFCSDTKIWFQGRGTVIRARKIRILWPGNSLEAYWIVLVILLNPWRDELTGTSKVVHNKFHILPNLSFTVMASLDATYV